MPFSSVPLARTTRPEARDRRAAGLAARARCARRSRAACSTCPGSGRRRRRRSAVVVSPPTGSSMPLTAIGHDGVDPHSRPLDPLGLALHDDPQLVAGVDLQRCRRSAGCRGRSACSTATSWPARARGCRWTASTSDRAGLDARRCGEQPDVRQAHDARARRTVMEGRPERPVDQGSSCFARSSASAGAMASREQT